MMKLAWLSSVLLLTAGCTAQNPATAPTKETRSYALTDANSFPFVIPWDDVTLGTATDASFLNVKPAGKNGRIIVKNGVFVEATTGKRVRFFGTNLGAGSAFPPKSEAPIIAKHLAKMGINIVRFHHLQNDWDTDHGFIWKRDKVQIEFDPEQVDRLDYFIAELIKEGIYVNMNLQTTRKMIPELGFPASVTQVPDFQKKLDKINDRMIALQKQYAKDLIDRKNPYLGRMYRDEPGLMVIEINNENSLCGWPGEQIGNGLTKWPEPFLSDLKSKWNAYLLAKYKTREALAKAWPNSDSRTGTSLTSRSTSWGTENQSNGDVKFEQIFEGVGAPMLSATIKSNPGPNWHVQAHVSGLNLVNGKTYTVEFKGRADRPLNVNIDSRLDQPDWRFLGLGATIQLDKEWKTHRVTFTASASEPNHARIGFTFGDVRGSIQIKDFVVREGAVQSGLQPDEKLGSIGIPVSETSPRYYDYAQFLIDTEKAYDRIMRGYLVDDLGFKAANIINSQIEWGGLSSLSRESESSFTDSHEYWNHPTFLGRDWDPQNYRVNRNALVNNVGRDTLSSLSIWRVAGKPFSVSEYNHPAPSDFQCEMMPLYAAAAGLQDWDIIYTFAWDRTGTGRTNDAYINFFDFATNPTKTAFFSSVAIQFRQGLLSPLGATTTIQTGLDGWKNGTSPSAFLDGKPVDWLSRRYQLSPTSGGILEKEGASASSQKVWGPEGRSLFVMDSQFGLSIAGFVGGKNVQTSFGAMIFGTTATDFAAMMVVPLDGQPLRVSKRMLLTLVGRVENTGMQWNAARDSVSDHWGTGPTRAEVVPMTLSLPGTFKFAALDGTGKPLAEWKTGHEIRVDSSTRSVWIEIRR